MGLSDSAVSLVHVTRQFGSAIAVDDLSLEIAHGQFVTLLGPSGCGKSTTLRMIGGFEFPDRGEIRIEGEVMAQRPPHQRPTSLVFQNYALFPHLTVAENVGFGLRERKTSTEEIRERVDAMLDLVELPGQGDRRPRELSGGQQQRVALARSLVLEPTVLLLDEPLGALDLRLRRQMQIELKRIQRRVGITFLYVTHDQEEALTMSDRIVVMNEGRIEQDGTSEAVFTLPQSRFVAEFMGGRNIHDAITIRDEAGLDGMMVAFGGLHVALPDLGAGNPGRSVTVMIRPERIGLHSPETSTPDGMCAWPATVIDATYKGAVVAYTLELPDGTPLIAEPSRDRINSGFATGDRAIAWFAADDLVIIPETSASYDQRGIRT